MKEKQSPAGVFLDNLLKAACESEPGSIEEIRQDLHDHRIDPEAELAAFQQLLKTHAPTWQERAEMERREAVRKLAEPSPPKDRAAIIEGIKQLVAGMQALGSSVPAGAFHRNFESAEQQDLESLFQDLSHQLQQLKSGTKRQDG